MKVVDLFAGCGGFSRSFKEEGFEIVCAVENFKPVAETYTLNFPEVEIIIKDIKEVRGEEIMRICGDVDVVIGSPPCEPFTSINARRKMKPEDRLYVDKRGILTLHFIRIVRELKPKIFVMENVPHILEVRKFLEEEFRKAGFDTIYFNLLRAENYGTPSKRCRVFISNIPMKDRRECEWVRVIEAIGDLPPPDRNTSIPNHEAIQISRDKLVRISALKWGESLQHFGRYSNWTRLHPYRLAPTVRGNSIFIHYSQDRILTVREHARLMGFPDYHIFSGGKKLQFEMVGESVPIPLGRRVAKFIVDVADGPNF